MLGTEIKKAIQIVSSLSLRGSLQFLDHAWAPRPIINTRTIAAPSLVLSCLINHPLIPSPPSYLRLRRHSVRHPIGLLHSFTLHLLLFLLHHRIVLAKLQAHTIYAVSLIRRRWVALSLEYMPKMSTAVRAYDFCAGHAKAAVCVTRHSAGNVVKVGRPAAARLKLVVGFVERRIAASAIVDASGRHVLVVGTGVGGFGTFLAKDTELF